MNLLAQVLQIGGFIAGLLFTILFYTLGNKSPWPFWLQSAFTTHFVGDYLSGFLHAPLLVGKFNISAAIKPPKFTQFVGIMLTLAGFLLVIFGHRTWGGNVFYLGFALALTGFVWDVIYP